jgi:hypothetical protein
MQYNTENEYHLNAGKKPDYDFWDGPGPNRSEFSRQEIEKENSGLPKDTEDRLTCYLNKKAAATDGQKLKLIFKNSYSKFGDHYNKSIKSELNINKDHSNYDIILENRHKAALWGCEQFEKMKDNMPDSYMKDMVIGMCKMTENNLAMRMWNHQEDGWDKFFHCMGNCEAAEFGSGGYKAAVILSNINEMGIFHDYDSENDQIANRIGRENPGRCYSTCSNFIPGNYRADLP